MYVTLNNRSVSNNRSFIGLPPPFDSRLQIQSSYLEIREFIATLQHYETKGCNALIIPDIKHSFSLNMAWMYVDKFGPTV